MENQLVKHKKRKSPPYKLSATGSLFLFVSNYIERMDLNEGSETDMEIALCCKLRQGDFVEVTHPKRPNSRRMFVRIRDIIVLDEIVHKMPVVLYGESFSPVSHNTLIQI